MSELTPITRIESYLDAIVNSGIPPTEDITRIETFLQAIYDNQVCALTPITRIEMFLGKISGQNIVLPEPITRIELYLAAIAGEEVELPENPITRLEMYLAEWADSGDWTTISGAIVEFVTQRAHKLKSCVVSLEPQQDLSHGDPSPTNICPISGWTRANVTRTGKNLLPNLKVQRGEGSYYIGQSEANVYATHLVAGNTYTLTFTANGTNPLAYFQRNGGPTTLWGASGTSLTFQDTTDIRLWVFASNLTQITDFQLELGSTATAYEEFKGNSYSVTFGETVYGAKPDVVSGEMPVTYALVDMGTLNWDVSYGRFSAQLPSIKPSSDQITKPNIFCSAYPTITPNEWYAKTLGVTSLINGYIGAGYVGLIDPAYSDAQTLKAALLGVKLVYELADPIQTTITPTPISTLKGYNAMWSDGDTIEVTVQGTPVELSTQQALNMLLGGAYRNNQTADDVSDDEALGIILGGENR